MLFEIINCTIYRGNKNWARVLCYKSEMYFPALTINGLAFNPCVPVICTNGFETSTYSCGEARLRQQTAIKATELAT